MLRLSSKVIQLVIICLTVFLSVEATNINASTIVPRGQVSGYVLRHACFGTYCWYIPIANGTVRTCPSRFSTFEVGIGGKQNQTLVCEGNHEVDFITDASGYYKADLPIGGYYVVVDMQPQEFDDLGTMYNLVRVSRNTNVLHDMTIYAGGY